MYLLNIKYSPHVQPENFVTCFFSCNVLCVSVYRTVVWCVHMCLVQALPVCVQRPLLGSAALSAQGFVTIGGKSISPAPPSLRHLIPARHAPVWSVWQFLLKWKRNSNSDCLINLSSLPSSPPLIRMRWWTVRRDLVQSSAPIRSLQIPAAPSVTPVCMRVSSTLTVTPSQPPPTPASAALVSEAPSPVCPWSAHQHPVSMQLPSQDSAVLSAQVLTKVTGLCKRYVK